MSEKTENKVREEYETAVMKEIQMFHINRDKLGRSREYVKKWLKEKFGVESSKDLSLDLLRESNTIMVGELNKWIQKEKEEKDAEKKTT